MDRKLLTDQCDDSFDPCLVVARLSDVEFNPLLPGGSQVLTWTRESLQEKAHYWRLKKSIGPDELDTESDIKFLRSLDPAKWKDQDHYAVMGLSSLRFRASDDDIKKAYRLRVLRHHPDKRQAAGEKVDTLEGDYFGCIVKAYEILGNPSKRRSYDSVDSYFPDDNLSRHFQNFYEDYGNWFDLQSRFSNIVPVPMLGNEFTLRVKVEEFYSFWYDFDSWREFSYLDEEEKEKGSDREERRYIDKLNKVSRAKHKKEAMAVIRSAVDLCYSKDPRIQRFKDEDLRKRNELKQAKQQAIKEAKLQDEKIKLELAEKNRLEREKLEEEERLRELESKKEKEALKKAAKKVKKVFRSICKDNDYFAADEKKKLDNMSSAEHLCEALSLTELEDLNAKLSELSFEDKKTVFIENVKNVNNKIKKEKEQTAKMATGRSNGVSGDTRDGGNDWTQEELTLLIKAVNVFPAGTNQRWEVVANFIHQHLQNVKKRTAKDVLAKAKSLQSSDFAKNSLKVEANENAFSNFEKSIKMQVVVEAEASVRDDATLKSASSPWTSEEQRLLEQALKTFPSSVADRWDRIAECVPGRSKKECVARFKELAALVKAKKSATNATVS